MNLSLQNITVKYSHKLVLDKVSAAFEQGKIHMLIGENGAGKSTLTKVICGDLLPSSGSIFINNKIVNFNAPKDAIKQGIVCVHQRPLLAESLSIMENLKLGVSNFNKEKANQILKVWLPDTKSSTLIKNAGGDERFFTSLCGALLKNPELLILDEPSSLLDINQREFLFEKLEEFAKKGMTIIVITHNMDEAKKYSDSVIYLKEGRISSFKDEFINKEISLKPASQKKAENFNEDFKKLRLSVKNLNSRPVNKPSLFNINFTALQNEITLISGLTESGRETLEDIITGMDTLSSTGHFILENSEKLFKFKIRNGNFTRRIMEKSDFKFGIIPSNKTFRASNPELTILQLLTSCIKGDKAFLENYAMDLILKANVNIRTSEKASCLSGGMLQRLILERELKKNPDVLILCEPVQGLDIISTEKICERLKKIAEEGKIVLVLSSSEFPENICQKIYFLKNGFLTEKK